MEELAVIENLIEGNRAPLRVRRALACVSRLHAGALTRLFRERVLHLAECDCTWPNYVFVRKRLQRAIFRFGGAGPPWPSGKWHEQLPVIQVEGERVLGPGIRTDEWYWNASSNWPLQLRNVQKATIFFLSRMLAELETPNASVGYGTLVVPIGLVQNALPGIHPKLDQHQPLGPELYQCLSGIAEVFALQQTRIIVDLKHRMLDDDAVPNVAHHLLKRHKELQSLNLSRTDPQHHCDVCLPWYLFGTIRPHVFPKLHTLRLNCVFMATNFGAYFLKEALVNHRLPALQMLDLRSVGLDGANAEILAPGLAVQQHTIRELALNDNQLLWCGLDSILQALKGSPSMYRLGVSGNPLTVGAVERLAMFIQEGNLPEIRQVEYYQMGVEFVRGHCAMSIALKCSKAQREWRRFTAGQNRGATPLGHNP